MKRFTDKGTIHIPKNKISRPSRKKAEVAPVILKECYCPNGHSLLDDNIHINENHAMKLKVVSKSGDKGFVALSPVYGDYSRVSIDIKLNKGDILDIYCPECDEKLPAYVDCTLCDSHMITVFTTSELSYSDCICICKQVGCHNSSIKSNRGILRSVRNNPQK